METTGYNICESSKDELSIQGVSLIIVHKLTEESLAQNKKM